MRHTLEYFRKHEDLEALIALVSRRAVTAAACILLLAPVVQAHEPKPSAEAASPPMQTPGQAPAVQNPPGQSPAPAPPQPHTEQKPPAAAGDASGGIALLGHFGRPEYLHTLLNPVPVYGLSMGLLALGAGLLMRSRRAVIAALLIIVVSGLAAWPTYYFGELAYERVKALSDGAGAQWLDEHMARGTRWIKAFYLLAAVALTGLVAPLKWQRSSLPLAIATLVLGAGTMGIGGWIAYAGGHIRHTEFRFEPPPPARSDGHTHTHGAEKSAMDHGKTPSQPAQSEQAKPMDHANMPGMEPGKSPEAKEQPMPHDMASPAAPTQEQLEASRLQLEASRLQLEASRKQLEAAEAAKEQTASPAPSAKPTATPEGHKH